MTYDKNVIKSIKLNKYMTVRTYTNVTLNTKNFYVYKQNPQKKTFTNT